MPIMTAQKIFSSYNSNNKTYNEIKSVDLKNIFKRNISAYNVRSPRLPIFSSFLSVSSNDLLRNELLNEFLCVKFFQYLDIINAMSIPELRNTFNIKIVNTNEIHDQQEDNINPTIHKKHGSEVCNLEILAGNALLNTPVPICPWHWLIAKREDRFPFQRPMAKCNCQKCNAKTIFDSNRIQLSRCNPSFTLMPTLVREKVVDDNEIWGFYLEEVATSCVCNIKLQTF